MFSKRILLVLLSLLLGLSIIINFTLVSYFFEYQQIKRDEVKPLFSLSDPGAQYHIIKTDLGYFSLEMDKNNSKYVILIGTSQVPLDDYVNKDVKVTGVFRKYVGAPNCFDPCPGNYSAPLIDIKDISLK